MAIRVRKDGRMFCAALRQERDGDKYIDDNLHYQMSVVHKVIVTEPADRHAINGEWWWRNSVPDGVVISEYYMETK